MERKDDQSLYTDSLLSTGTNQPKKKENRFDGLTNSQVWAYGSGHFANDLGASIWFIYMLYYLKKVIVTDSAATAIFVGQIVDGIATPIIGTLSDKYNTRIGQRKPWYILGSFLVPVCTVFLFLGYNSDAASQYAYYCIFASLWNIGWAALQISHMSLVPSLTCSRRRRDKLNNLRNSFTFIANFLVLSFGLVIFISMSNSVLEFNLISGFVAFCGISASILFCCKINEPQLTRICVQKADELKGIIAERKKIQKAKVEDITQFSDSQSSTIKQSKRSFRSRKQKKQSVWDWFKMPKFYLFGVCYLLVRLYFNLFRTLLPFYLIDVLKMGDQDPKKVSFNLSLVPMITYLSSFGVALNLNWFYTTFGRKNALYLGSVICVCCLAIMAVIQDYQAWIMYAVALFIGVSQSLVLSTGVNLISDVIGSKAKSGAFVFGIYSMLDKFASGVAIMVLGSTDSYSKQNIDDVTQTDQSFIRWTIVLVSGISCVFATLIVMSYPIQEYGKKVKNQDKINVKTSFQEQLVV